MTDHEAATLFARALAAVLDQWGHMPWCDAWTEDAPCTYDVCRQVREAVKTARSLGYLDAPTPTTEAR